MADDAAVFDGETAEQQRDQIITERLHDGALSAGDLRYFQFAHLPPRLRERSRPFAELALRIVEENHPGSQRDLALQLLIQAKDAAVRAALP